jgi:CIC family chloride channel protein
MGVSLGREGALKDTAGAIASKLSDWFSLPDEQRCLLVACAAGAGMAAAYNIPLGGALFAVEVLLGSLSFAWVLPALAASMLATAASWLLLPNRPAYNVPAYVLHPADLLWVLLAAPLFGLAAVLWVRALAWAQTRKPQGWHALAAPLVVFPLVGVAAIWFPDLLGNGKGLVQRAFVDALDLKLLGSLLVLRLLATAGCLATGAPGGVFTPTMAFGALLGGGLGRIWAVLVPVSAAAPDVGAFAVIGSAAVLAAATQGPISSIVMMIELTHHVDAIMVPILLATVIAALTASRMERRSVYSAAVKIPAKIPAKIPTETPAAINPAGAVSAAPARSDLTPR